MKPERSPSFKPRALQTRKPRPRGGGVRPKVAQPLGAPEPRSCPPGSREVKEPTETRPPCSLRPRPAPRTQGSVPRAPLPGAPRGLAGLSARTGLRAQARLLARHSGDHDTPQETKQGIFLNHPTCLGEKKKKNRNPPLDVTESISKKDSKLKGSILKQRWFFKKGQFHLHRSAWTGPGDAGKAPPERAAPQGRASASALHPANQASPLSRLPTPASFICPQEGQGLHLQVPGKSSSLSSLEFQALSSGAVPAEFYL